MLYLNREQKDELIDHAKNAAPLEACGILAGKNKKAEKIYRMTNQDKSPTTFFMDPKEQLKAMKEMRDSDLEMIGIYHSHPQTEPYPSMHDVELAFYPEASYVVVSLKNKENPKIKSFKIIDGKITQEQVKII